MTPSSGRSAPMIAVYVVAALFLIAVFAVILMRLGNASTVEEPYAPYTAGPVIHEEPYAPYEAGPVIHESDLYAPYTTTTTEPYAPYEAGPVIHPSDLAIP